MGKEFQHGYNLRLEGASTGRSYVRHYVYICSTAANGRVLSSPAINAGTAVPHFAIDASMLTRLRAPRLIATRYLHANVALDTRQPDQL